PRCNRSCSAARTPRKAGPHSWRSAPRSGRGSSSMRAAVCHEYGAPDVVRVEDILSPEPAAGQVRVRINAAAVNFPDVLIVANEYQIKIPPPFVPGSEFAGLVAAVGDGARDL